MATLCPFTATLGAHSDVIYRRFSAMQDSIYVVYLPLHGRDKTELAVCEDDVSQGVLHAKLCVIKQTRSAGDDVDNQRTSTMDRD